jgi:hypothetical protein
MRCPILLSILCLATTVGLSQPTFRKGYFLSDDGKRTEGEMRIINEEWADNPKSFEYRLSSSDKPITPDLASVTELGFTGGEIFRRLTVLIDRSRDDVGRLDKERNPVFRSETLFLRLQVDGKAILYAYDEGLLHRFFYTIDGSPIQQLVYKRYLNNNGDLVANENFKQQLFNDFKCKDISAGDITQIKYDTSPLTKLFVRYNKCVGSVAVTNEWKDQYNIPVHFTIRPGVTFNSLQVKNISLGGGGTANLDNVISFRIGAELEVGLPFGEGLWAGFFEPSYQVFSSQLGTLNAEFSMLDLHLGLRKYFPAGSGRLYLSSSLLYSTPQNVSLTSVSTQIPLESTFGWALAGGYKVKSFSVELYYLAPRNLSRSSNTYRTTFGGPALIFGYTIK